MNLSTLAPRPGAKHRVKRLGCGESSGHGKTSGKGHKGQKARSGGSIRLGFEGGQMPLARKIPKRGFSNKAFRTEILVVNLGVVDGNFDSGDQVTKQTLVDRGLISDRSGSVKILGSGELTKVLKFSGVTTSAAARVKIEAAGGSIA